MCKEFNWVFLMIRVKNKCFRKMIDAGNCEKVNGFSSNLFTILIFGWYKFFGLGMLHIWICELFMSFGYAYRNYDC